MSRLDTELVARGISRSRERAKELIKSGFVRVNGKKADRPSYEVAPDDKIEAETTEENFVGRGALKLKKAAEEFELDFSGKVCIDVGASTGGFTDFMLRNGAVKVYAVDVGHGQLAQELRNDSRAVNAEGIDIRETDKEFFGGEADFIAVDVSFISLRKILPKLYELLKNGAYAAVLIKPQFEAGRSNIGKHGIVKDKKVHETVLAEIDEYAASVGFYAQCYTYSPVKGGSGNIEYLVKLVKSDERREERLNFSELVKTAFNQL